MMNRFVSGVLKASKLLHVVAGVALTLGMCVTVADVLGRMAGHPLMGAYEVVGVLGIVVIGCAIPITSWERSGHVNMDIVVALLPKRLAKMVNVFSRLLCMALFVFLSINLFQQAVEFSKSGEGTLYLIIPFFPFACGLGVCCAVECLVFVCDIIKIREGRYE